MGVGFRRSPPWKTARQAFARVREMDGGGLMAGRRPKPTAMKKAAGNPGKRKLNKSEPAPAAHIPICPPHLDQEAKAEWTRIAPELLKLNVLANVDRAALAAYCMAWSRWVDAETNLRKFGTVIKTKQGYPVQNPYLGIANTAIDTMRKMLVEFGMTPSSRSRVNAAPPDDPESVDPWDQLGAPPSPKVQ